MSLPYKIEAYCSECGVHFLCGHKACSTWKRRLTTPVRCVCKDCLSYHGCKDSIEPIKPKVEREGVKFIGKRVIQW